jgi:nucleoside-diphosphate-sugar epimerase
MERRLKILLTGASGTVGIEVLRQLCAQPDRFDVTAFDLNSKKVRKILAPFTQKSKIIYGDISNDDDLSSACHNKDVVIHLAAVIPPVADDNPDLARSVNTEGTANIIRNLKQFSPDTFFIYSSSISVYGDRLNKPFIKIDDPLIPSKGDEYAKTKIAAEKTVRDSKLKWSIFRLTAIMGGHKVSKLMFHMPLSTAMEIATPADTARAFVLAIDKQSAMENKIYNLGGGVDCRTTYHDFLVRSFTIFGLGKPNFPDKAFAERNFHCGYYQDGDELDNVLKFRRDSLEDYYDSEAKKVPFWQKILTSVFNPLIKNYLLKQSEPLHAHKTKNLKMMEHYFH